MLNYASQHLVIPCFVANHAFSARMMLTLRICILLSFFMLINLALSTTAYAELRDPTRPPGFIEGGAAVVTTWQLDAVIISNDRKVAVINGQTVKIGDDIAGKQLVDIQPNSVQLQGSDGKITLFLLDSTLKMDEQTN